MAAFSPAPDPSDARARLRGSLCALATPFRAGAVDFPALEALVSWQIASGTRGLIACGTTGEAPTLSAEERRAVVGAVVEIARGRVPVLAGTGGNNTRTAIEETRAMADLGVSAALVVTPYYNRPSQEGLVAHYTALHDGVDVPLVLYTVPGRTGSDISLEALKALAAMPRVIGIKDANADMARVSLTRQICGADFLQLSGEDATALGFNAHGGHGCIGVTANVAPAECAALQEASLAGDFVRAREIQDRLMPLHEALFVETSPQPVKYALSVRGLCTDEMRLPLLPASERARAAVDRALSHAGLGTVEALPGGQG